MLHVLQRFFAMPRRIRLTFREAKQNDRTSAESEWLVASYLKVYPMVLITQLNGWSIRFLPITR